MLVRDVTYESIKLIASKEDYAFVFVVALVLTSLRGWVQNYLTEIAKAKSIKESRKFAESGWKIAFYICSFSWGSYLVKSLDLFPETINCWAGEVDPESHVQLFYLFELGFYVHALFTHLFVDVRRKDFWQLLFHHIVTIGLIHFSYACGYYRIGLLVLACHDVSDIALEGGKLAVYRGAEIEQIVWYVGLVLSWALTRLVIFPFKVINSTFFESKELSKEPPFYWPFNIGLFCLLALHVYWFNLILQVGIRKVYSNKMEDVREDDD